MAELVVSPGNAAQERITFATHPERYRHWTLSVEGRVATLAMNVDESGGIRPGYRLKLNSYDLGVDIELHDALQRLRFEHPDVGCVILTSIKPGVFCSGANIFMLAQSSHAWKVNFCKFTNETRNGMEDASRGSGLKFIAACNGTTAGGGYELALACDEIFLVDDRSAAVSLPEVPLLGVLPGTGGLTRLTDKRRVRRDHADVFCTLSEGIRAPRAMEWGLVDRIAKPQQFAQYVGERARALAAQSDRPASARGIELTPLQCRITADRYEYSNVDVRVERARRTATVTVRAPRSEAPNSLEEIVASGAAWWPLSTARELDDAILMLRTNELDVGTWLLRTEGAAAHVLAADRSLVAHEAHWFVRETVGMLRRTFARLDVSSRSLFAIIDAGSCFVGTLFELALAADRSYMLTAPASDGGARIALSSMNFGPYPTVARTSRMAARFYGAGEPIARARATIGTALDAAQASTLGLITMTPDALDWEDEIRLAVEERASLSPDALTGLEANLRFGGEETPETRIFGRLSAWQNWIFNRPNAVGEAGALKAFGTGSKIRFNWERV
jgi:benzoyl-CoA-dihydrodiol lyase